MIAISNDNMVNGHLCRAAFNHRLSLLCVPDQPANFRASFGEFGHDQTCEFAGGTNG